MLPGWEVIFRDGGNPSQQVGGTDQGFVVAEAERGPTEPTLIESWSQLLRVYGGRLSTSWLYDGAEAALTIGTRRLWVSRVVGPAAAAAGLNLSDGTATTFRVEAKWVGAYGNNFTVQVLTTTDDAAIPSGSFKLRIRESGSVVEDSLVFVTKADALAWSDGLAQTVRLVDGAGTGDPARIAATALTGGADDRAGILEAHWTAALDRFTADLGPGQVAGFGRTTLAWRTAAIDHARTRNRHALLDMADTASTATVITDALAANASASSQGGRFASAYWPWAKIPGVNRVGTRTIPYTAVQMGLCALVERLAGPGQAAAGEDYGGHDFVVGLSQDTKSISDTTRQALDDAGVNVALTFFGLAHPVTYGNRTLVNPSIDPLWRDASGSRTMMLIAHLGGQIMRKWALKRVDGAGVSLGTLQTRLGGMLSDLYDAGALFGATFNEAASVDAFSMNTPAQLMSGLVGAGIEAAISPNPERAQLVLTRAPITEGV